jgi:hypothetical protein
MTMHPLVKRLLDGEMSVAELPPELRAEGERMLRLVDGADRAPVVLSPAVERRVMDAVRRRVATPRPAPALRRRRHWGRWVVGGALAAATVAGLLLIRPRPQVPAPGRTAYTEPVRFVFHAPDARAVAVAGSFNDWSPVAAPLARGDEGAWTVTLSLKPGQHEYAFVVDGRRWVADPAAPAIDDGFGRRNSIVAVSGPVL